MASEREDREHPDPDRTRSASIKQRGRDDPSLDRPGAEGSLHGAAMFGAAIEAQRYLGGVDYPTSRRKLVEFAESHGAPEEVHSLLRRIPDQQYESSIDVSQAIGSLR